LELIIGDTTFVRIYRDQLDGTGSQLDGLSATSDVWMKYWEKEEVSLIIQEPLTCLQLGAK